MVHSLCQGALSGGERKREKGTWKKEEGGRENFASLGMCAVPEGGRY